MTKKLLCSILALCMLLALFAVPALAADPSQKFLFELSADGKSEKQVNTGDIVTISLTLKRTDSGEDYTMYAMQDEILYDSSFFELVDSSIMTAQGITSKDLATRDGNRVLYLNYVSMTGGESWKAETMVGTFQMKVIGMSGSSVIRSSNNLVSTKDGQSSFETAAQDMTVVVSVDCTVRFETNGGSEVPDQTVAHGEKVTRPDDPVKEGYHLEGWYSDIDLQNRWDFDRDTVAGNMTLHAKWAEGAAATVDGGSCTLLLSIIAAAVLVLLLVLILVLRRKTVRFETNGGGAMESLRVKKGAVLPFLAAPEKDGCIFDGWYRDMSCTEAWNPEKDTVEHNMTLYAKWR